MSAAKKRCLERSWCNFAEVRRDGPHTTRDAVDCGVSLVSDRAGNELEEKERSPGAVGACERSTAREVAVTSVSCVAHWIARARSQVQRYAVDGSLIFTGRARS